MSAKRSKKTYSPAERRRRNRRFNTILYIIAGILILGGIALIISDQTLFFPNTINSIEKIAKRIATGEDEVLPTIPPFQMQTMDPGATYLPWHDSPFFNPDLYTYVPVVTEEPEPTLAPGVTPDPNATPRPTREPGPAPTAAPVYPYQPTMVYFLDEYIQNNITSISCPVDPVGYNSAGHMDTVHSAFRAGWFQYGGDPARGGNTLIAGHNRYSGRMGYFSIIKDMQAGDYVIVELQNGQYAYYVVDSVTEYPYDAVPDEVMNTGGQARLTLITCKGDYSSIIHTSRTRIIAVCYPVFFGGGETEAPEETPEYTPDFTPDFTPEPALTPEPTEVPGPDNTRLP